MIKNYIDGVRLETTILSYYYQHTNVTVPTNVLLDQHRLVVTKKKRKKSKDRLVLPRQPGKTVVR